MQIGNFSNPNRPQFLRQEVERVRQTVEQAPASDVFETATSRVLDRPQGDILSARVARDGSVTATLRQGEATIELSSEVVRQSNTALQVAAGAVGALLGVALGGASKSRSLALGALAGGLAAWGTRQATDKPDEFVVRRVETGAEGITTETLKSSSDNEIYTSKFRRTAPPKPMDPQAVKDYIDSLDI